MIAITGASGPFGLATTQRLIKKGIMPSDLLLITRHPDKLSDMAARGATVRFGDFDDYNSLVSAFQGATKLLMISTNRVGQREPQHTNAVNAAVEVGVEHIVYTSFVGKEGCVSLAIHDHRFTEDLIKKSGLTWTFLRNSQYAEAMRDAGAPQSIKTGKWLSSTNGGRIAMVSREDCIDAAVAVMGTSGHDNTVYNITGPELVSYKEVCDLIAEISGYPIDFIEVKDEDLYALFDAIGVPRSAKDDNVVNGFGWCSDDMVSFEATIRDGDFAVISDDVKKLTGKDPISLRDFFMKHQPLLQSFGR